MAYAQPEEDKNALDPNAQATTGPEGGADLGAGGGGSGGNNAGPAEPSAPAGSGTGPSQPFVGIKQYIDANKPQSQKLASNVGGYVGGLSQSVRDTLPKQTDAYNQAVDQNTVKLNQGLVDETKQNAAGVAGNQQKLGEFQKMRDAQYKGPTAFQTSEFYKPTEDAFKKATTAGQNTLTEQGQRSLINQYQQDKTGKVGGSGTTTFDQMLLGSSPNGRAELEKARTGQNDLQGLIDAANTASQAKAAEAQRTTDATKNAIQSTFGGSGAYGQQNIQQQLQQRAAERIQASRDQDARIKQALRNNGQNLSSQDMAVLGLSDQDFRGLQDLQNQVAMWAPVDEGGGFGSGISGGGTTAANDLSQFLTQYNPEAQINAQNVASGDEYARYAALNQLMGTNNSFLSDPSQAGKASTDTLDFNTQGARNYMTDLIQKYMNQANQAGGGGGGDNGGTSTWQNVKDNWDKGAAVLSGSPESMIYRGTANAGRNVVNNVTGGGNDDGGWTGLGI